MRELKFDPLNIVVCGIGGQGNVLAAEVLGSAMCDRGFRVAVGLPRGTNTAAPGWPWARPTAPPSGAAPS